LAKVGGLRVLVKRLKQILQLICRALSGKDLRVLGSERDLEILCQKTNVGYCFNSSEVFYDFHVVPPNLYTIKTCFDGASPTIKNNALTTDFRLHSGREHYEKVYVPGSRGSPRTMDYVPGPGTYSY